MKRGKRYLEAAKQVDRLKEYKLLEATELVKKTSTVKFDASVEVAFRLNLDPRKAEQNLRGAIVLPHGTGKVSKVVVIAQGEKAKEAKDAGADFVGDKDLIDQISKGWFDFDVIVATPDMMAQLGKLGRVLGPKGLMPNPKTGTVTLDVANAVKEIKAGKIEYRVDKVGNIHASVGKVSFTKEQLAENIHTLFERIVQIKPSTVKGTYLKNLTVTSSMGPGIKIDRDDMREFKK
ncbi:50S ribosomal protein L1 [Haploplasma modicum]|jgi:large subunit ribosomal protein L1|uniref:50S ribosomal protein L1 n=1 Tax=Haploplasma modicum TaxID=2150 RepID=UPI00047E4AA4|nr:50S ribosomal protein L1 [Haploplasma modicum]MCR1809151.1 50S ribosomal protein L1 [Haploplasma modicum]